MTSEGASAISRSLVAVVQVALIAALGCAEGGGSGLGSAPSSWSRVAGTGELRAGYISYAPYCIKDPGTGELSGIFVEILEEVGRRLDLRVEWVEEVGFGTVFEGFASGRYEILGSGLWQNPARSKAAFFTKPLFYNPVLVWGAPFARSEFAYNVDAMNSESTRIAVQDGAIEDLIAARDFPSAERISIPQLNQWTDVLLLLTSGKADVTFAEPGAVLPFLEKNPGSLVVIPQDRPTRVFANSYAIPFGDSKLQEVLDGTISELQMDGTVEAILRKYETGPGQHYRVARPYELLDATEGVEAVAAPAGS